MSSLLKHCFARTKMSECKILSEDSSYISPFETLWTQPNLKQAWKSGLLNRKREILVVIVDEGILFVT